MVKGARSYVVQTLALAAWRTPRPDSTEGWSRSNLRAAMPHSGMLSPFSSVSGKHVGPLEINLEKVRGKISHEFDA